MNWPSYLLQINIYLVLFYAFYTLVLQSETFFKWNRIFLVASGSLSFLIPAIQLNWAKSLSSKEIMLVKEVITINSDTKPEVHLLSNQLAADSITTGEYFAVIYFLGVFVCLCKFAWQLLREVQAQSFFRRIKVSDNLPSKDLIVQHEEVHARQFHSADVIYFELLSIINWFNPVVYAYKKSVKYIHEFIADEEVSNKSNKSDYALLLISNAFGIKKEQLTNNFYNQSFLKKRITMLHKMKSRKTALLKYGLSAPLFVGMLIFSSATIEKSKMVQKAELAIKWPYSDLNSLDVTPKIFSGELKGDVKNVKHNATKPIIQETLAEQDTSLQEHPGKYKKPSQLMTQVFEELRSSTMDDFMGNAIYSITLSEKKKISNIELLEGVGSKWEKNIITKIKNYTDTIDIAPGKYSFLAYNTITKILGDKTTKRNPILNPEKYIFIVGQNRDIHSEIIYKDDSSSDETKISTFINGLGLKNPLIIIDHKEVSYTISENGLLKLSETIHPKKVLNIIMNPTDVIILTTKEQ
jgi:hypothetical protein